MCKANQQHRGPNFVLVCVAYLLTRWWVWVPVIALATCTNS